VRHQPAQGDDLGAQRAEAFDENDGVEQEHATSANYPSSRGEFDALKRALANLGKYPAG
jgi:hypothetical protein